MPPEAWVLIAVALCAGVAIFLILRLRSGGMRGGGEERERDIENSAHLVRGVLLRLVDAVHRLDSATDTSTASLNAARVEVNNINHIDGVKQAQTALIDEIDGVISTNNSLRTELADAQKTLREQREQIEALRTAIRIDPLTRIHNRAAFDERLAEAWHTWERYEECFALVMIDADHFKRVNDEHGHPAGDRVLRGLAQKLKESVRGSDFVARYGGEEFAVILPKSDREAAREAAGKLRAAVEATHFNLDRQRLSITISLGVADARGAASAEALLGAADRALYRAKDEGRNRVCVAGDA